MWYCGNAAVLGIRARGGKSVAISVENLARYLHEATFQCNGCNVKTHPWLRLEALINAAFWNRITSEDLKA